MLPASGGHRGGRNGIYEGTMVRTWVKIELLSMICSNQPRKPNLVYTNTLETSAFSISKPVKSHITLGGKNSGSQTKIPIAIGPQWSVSLITVSDSNVGQITVN